MNIPKLEALILSRKARHGKHRLDQPGQPSFIELDGATVRYRLAGSGRPALVLVARRGPVGDDPHARAGAGVHDGRQEAGGAPVVPVGPSRRSGRGPFPESDPGLPGARGVLLPGFCLPDVSEGSVSIAGTRSAT